MEREQILGSEARAQVPAEFVAQNSLVMNPPTLLLAVQKTLRKLHSTKSVEIDSEGNSRQLSQSREFAKEVFPALLRWIRYFEQTQQSASPGAFRWYGRTESHCLASGIDDFPRPAIVSPREGHVDLLAWLGFAYGALSDLADSVYDDGAMAQELAQKAKLLYERLDNYWDETAGFFGDVGVKEGVSSVETHVGYVGLLPLALELLEPEDPRLAKLLDAIEDPAQVGKRWKWDVVVVGVRSAVAGAK